MPNKRRKGVKRITLTIHGSVLYDIEEWCDFISEEYPGTTRLDFIRDAIFKELDSYKNHLGKEFQNWRGNRISGKRRKYPKIDDQYSLPPKN